MKNFSVGSIISAAIVLLLASAGVAFAALTFNSTSITGDSSTTIDATGTISIGASTATGITIGNANSTVTLPGTVTITGATTTVNNLVINGTCTGAGCGGGSMPSSTTYEYISALGCAQGADLNSGDVYGSSTPATDAAPCINAALAKATPQHPIVLIQDGVSAVSGIFGPNGGNWGIEGLGGGIAQAPIIAWSISSNVATFTTKPGNNLVAGQTITLGGFPISTFFNAPDGGGNASATMVLAMGLTSSTFEINFTHAPGSATEAGEADYLEGTGFYEMTGSNNDVIHNGIAAANVPVDPQTIPPARGSTLLFKDFIINGNRGNGTNGDSTAGDPRGDTNAWFFGINIMNMNNVTIDGVQFYNTPTFNFRCNNCGYVNVVNSKFTNVLPNAATYAQNGDGVHIDGPSNDINITNDFFRTTDDAIALNAPEGYAGKINNVVISNDTSHQSQDMLRIYTNSIAANTVSNVSISNYSGDANNFIGLFGLEGPHSLPASSTITNVTWANSTFAAAHGSIIDDNIGTLTFDNDSWQCTSGGGGFIEPTEVNTTVDALTLNNDSIIRNASGSCGAGAIDSTQNIFGSGGSSAFGTVSINGFKIVDQGGINYGTTGALLILGGSTPSTINTLSLSDNDFYDINALQSGGTITTITPTYTDSISPQPGSSNIIVNGNLTDPAGNKYSTSTTGSVKVSTPTNASEVPYWIDANGDLSTSSPIETSGSDGKFVISYAYYRAITVTSTISTQTDFPFLFSGTYTWLKSASNGGLIQNLTTAPNGGTEPADLIFTSDAGCSSPLNFETESYSSSTGAISDWVNIPTLTAGTVIYACYDGASITTDQSHPSSTWNTNYQGVWHLPNGTALSTDDSTGNGNNGTNSGATATTGEIDGAGAFNGTSDYIGLGTLNLLPTGVGTVSAWVKLSTTTLNNNYVVAFGDDNGPVSWGLNLMPADASHLSFSLLYGSAKWVNSGTLADIPTDWHLFTAVMNGNSTQSLYIDGVLVGSGSLPVITPATGNGFNIGKTDRAAPFQWFTDGDIDEVRVSSGARSSSWIAAEYSNESSPSTFYTAGSQQIENGNHVAPGETFILGSANLEATTTVGGFLDVTGPLSTVRIGTGGVNPGCIEMYDMLNSSTIDYGYYSSLQMVVTTTKPVFCQ